MRTIVLHYHLFKNAGTSLDRILQRNFADRWVTSEFKNTKMDNTALVHDWIRDTPDAVAYSSHTMMGPLPVVDDVNIIPIVLLRDPVARIRSAYQFERTQVADTWGAQLAKTHDFDGYVRARIEKHGDRQCQNFQTWRLASLQPGDDLEVMRAIKAAKALHKTGVLGRVSAFNDTVARLAARLMDAVPDFKWDTVQANTTKPMSTEHSSDLEQRLRAENLCDFYLLDIANQILDTPVIKNDVIPATSE